MKIEDMKIIVTKEDIVQDLVKLGVKKGMTIIVHSSLSSIGYVPCGPITVIKALMEVVTDEGTIVMPAQSTNYSNPKDWCNPPVPKEWVPIVKKSMLPFEKDITPTRGMGCIAEYFRKYPNVIRSNHPHVSFCAWGKNAKYIIKDHKLDYPFGENTPLSKLYDLNSFTLLIGVPYEVNTSFHLADNRMDNAVKCTDEAPILENGVTVWKEYKDIETNEEIFNAIGAKYEEKYKIKKGNIGQASCKLLKVRESVDFAVDYLNKNKL